MHLKIFTNNLNYKNYYATIKLKCFNVIYKKNNYIYVRSLNFDL